MKNLNLTLSLALIFALASCQSLNGKSQQTKNIVATYKGGSVTSNEVNYELNKIIAGNDKLKNLTFDQLNKDQKEALVKEVVLKNSSYKEAKRRGLNKDSDYQEALKIFESDLLKQKLLVALVKEAQEEKNVRKNYDKLAAEIKGKKDFKISYIAVKTQKEAEEISKILAKSPSSFAAQAKKKSIDKEVGKNGGQIGFILEDSLAPEVTKEIKSLKKDEISKPIFTSNRWVIIRFEDERSAEILPYEKAKDALAQNLAKKAVEDFVSESIKKAEIKIN
jgi:peptidyl-prolyl cis-trans isomerase C